MDENIIRSELRRLGYNISKTARELDLDYLTLKEAYAPDDIVRTPSEPRPLDYRLLGKPSMRRYVVAVKMVSSPEWPDEFARAIYIARRAFDAGTHIMCQQTRKDGWCILYSIPRKRPLKNPTPWFFIPEPV